MNSLYEISHDYLVALDNLEIDMETGEILNYEAVDALTGQFEEKAESVACYIKNLDAFAASIKAEEFKLAERRKNAERKADNLKKYLTSCLDAVNREKLETARTKVSFRKSVQVSIADEAVLPADFKVETVTVKPDKTAIKKAIQDGQEVNGASLVENRNIQIK